MATARDKNGYTPCETMDTSTAKLKDTTIITEEGCRPDCQYRNLRELSSESACEQCEYEKQLDTNGYAHFDISTYRPSYYRYRPENDKKWPSTWKIVVLVLLIVVLVIGAVIVGYYIKGDKESDTTSCPPTHKTQVSGPPLDHHHLLLLHENLMYSITGDKISKFFRNYTRSQIYTGSEVDRELMSHIRSYFTQLGLQDTGLERQQGTDLYRALLSYPNPREKNNVQLLDENGDVFAQYVPGFQEPQSNRTRRDVDDSALQPFVSYSPPGEAQGKLLYLNYGSYKDYEDAMFKQVQLNGRIALLRLGKIAVQQKIQLAEKNGVAGVLLYADPADTEHHHLSVCDHRVPYVTVNDVTGGDPDTPGLPAYAEFGSATSTDNLPTIPVQTVSCQFAAELIGNMTGYVAPLLWKGGIQGIRYTIEDEEDKTQEMRLNVFNERTVTPVHNVIGTLTGEEDPDQYVIVGASRTSFGVGDSGGIVGTALLLALAEQLNFLVEREAWRPNRTIKLISWGGGEFGNIGMVEYLEEYEDILRDRIVAYIDLDQPVIGTYVPYIEANNILSDIIYNVAQRVPSPDDLQSMLFNTWVERTSTRVGRKPKIHPAYTSLHPNPFTQKLGVPTAHWRYIEQKHKTANGSLLETEAHKIWPHHTAVGRLSGLLALSLADASVLQYNIITAVASLKDETLKFIRTVEATVTKNTTTGVIKKEVEHVLSVSNSMEHYISSQLDFGIHSQRRIVNERLLQFQSLISKAQMQLKLLSQRRSMSLSILKNELTVLLKYLRTAAHSFRLEL